MSLDITPQLAPGQLLINACGDGGFRIAGTRHSGSQVIAPGGVSPWLVESPDDVTVESLTQALTDAPQGSILIVGCGPTFVAPPAGLREAIREAGPVMEWMDTRAACRTFNVLLIEGRDVAAALIAVS
jgi:uncharacterized protein